MDRCFLFVLAAKNCARYMKATINKWNDEAHMQTLRVIKNVKQLMPGYSRTEDDQSSLLNPNKHKNQIVATLNIQANSCTELCVVEVNRRSKNVLQSQ